LKADAAREDDAGELSDREEAIVEFLRAHGASFFAPLHDAVGGGYPAQTVDALWNLVWRGLITNDTFHALRAFTRTHTPRRKARRMPAPASAFRSRRMAPPSAEGRWSLVPRPRREVAVDKPDPRRSRDAARQPRPADASATTQWAAAMTQQLLARHGVVTREAAASENVPGGFGLIYPVLKGLEETGRIRRGYFVAGLGATQFALPGALDLLRSLRDVPDDPEVAVLAATDPASPYGATLKWPSMEGRGPTRSIGATVVLVNGALAAYLARGDRQLLTYLPESEPDRSKTARAIATVLIERARTGFPTPRGMLIEEIDGTPPSLHPLAPYLVDAGFVSGALGLQATQSRQASASARDDLARAPARPRPSPPRSTVSSPFARRYLADDEPTSD
jgi:ATP-dependent Lhr-like helicase